MIPRTCKEIRELLPLFVDGALGEAESRSVRDHLGGCRECRREADRWAALDRVVAAGLTFEEPTAAADVEAVVQRLREVRPAWQAAPTPVRFWRNWAPAAALAGVAVILAVAGLYSPGVDLSAARSRIGAEAAAVPDDFVALNEAARSWPGQAREAALEQANQGAALAEAVLRWVGPAPLVACAVLLLAINLVCARSARLPRQRLQRG
jgi:predicted anti-sigma-YlaC factor YlaD